MKHLFVPFELAKLLKEKGFNEPCFRLYTEKYKELITAPFNATNTSIENSLPTKPLTAPLYCQVIDWFRDKHLLHITAEFSQLKDVNDDENIELYGFRINEQWQEGKDWFDYKYGFKHIENQHSFKSYYEALTKAIEEAIKLIKN